MKKNLIVKQQSNKDCGVCSLLSIIKYYNGYIPLEVLRKDTLTNNEGTTAYHLIKTLQKYDFDAIGIKISLNKLKEYPLPAIVHLNINGFNHFVVLYKITNKTVTIMDPSYGFRKIKLIDFEKIYDEVAIILTPLKKIVTYKQDFSITKLFKNILQKESKLIFKIILMSFILTICSIISGFYLKIGTESLNQNYFILNLKFVIFIFFLLVILKILTNYLRNIYEVELNKNIDLNIMVPFINHIFKLPLRSIQTRSTGEINTRIYELQNIKELFSKILISIFLDLLLALGAIFILFNISKTLTFITLIILILYALIGLLVSPTLKKKVLSNIDLETEFNYITTDYLKAIETIKTTHKKNFFIDNLESKLINFIRNTFHLNKFVINLEECKDILHEIGLFIIMSVGIFLLSKNELSLINLITYQTLLIYLTEPIKNSIDLIPKILYIKSSFDKINEFINIEEEKLTITNEEFVAGNITFNNLCFSYDGYHSVLDNFNLNINKGAKVILEGPSGCGKSTICRLLFLLENNFKGNIKIASINILDYQINTIRDNISYLSQNDMIISATIEENIKLGTNISKQKFNEICQICCIEEILKNKPLRYQTLLFDNGANLSGGEKQRILLARTLVKKKKIIILDEALSEVSFKMEQKIIKDLLNYYREQTLIYVSHRPSNLFKERIKINA